MKSIHLVVLLACLFGLCSAASANDTVTLRGLLVAGSNQPGESDRRLAPYLSNLKRIIRAESFRLIGEDSATIPVPGNSTLSLGGAKVQISTENANNRNVLVKARWGSVRQEYLLQRGSSTLLIDPSGKKGEVQAVILIGR